MAIKLVACDIDNTLVRFPNPPSLRVTRALRAAQDAGVTVALVTGRAFRRALPIAQSLGLTAPLVCNHGGSIREPVEGCVIHHETLHSDFVLQVVTWLQTQHVRMMLFDGDHVYRDCTAEQVVPDFQVYTSEDRTTFVRDLRVCIPERTEVLLTSSLDHEHLVEVYHKTRARFGEQARVLLTHPFGMDVLSSDATKSKALAWLAGSIGVTAQEVMAIGDGDNDVDMLAWAGLGVAMGDGQERTRGVADVVAPSFDEDGVAWAVERYVLRAGADA